MKLYKYPSNLLISYWGEAIKWSIIIHYSLKALGEYRTQGSECRQSHKLHHSFFFKVGFCLKKHRIACPNGLTLVIGKIISYKGKHYM